MRAFVSGFVLLFLSGCSGNPLTQEIPCAPVHPSFDSVEVHADGSLTLTTHQIKDLLLYIDELERCIN